VPLNQDKKESIETAAITAEELLGDLPVDYIINNAAYVSLLFHLSLWSSPVASKPPVYPGRLPYDLDILIVYLAPRIRQT
jgi:hypothetical protein